jgi:hypothetical protein
MKAGKMKRFVNASLVCVWILTVLTGCLNTPLRVTPQASQVPTEIVTSTTGAALKTVTPLPVKKTATPTITPTFTPIPDSIDRNCIFIQDKLPDQHSYAGYIVLHKFAYSPEKSKILLFDTKAGKTVSMSEDDYSFEIYFSPDHTKLALHNWDTNRLELMDAKWKQIKVINWKKYWGWIAGWIDNQRLAIIESELDAAGDQVYPVTVIAYNPYTKQEIILSPDFPDIDIASHRVYWETWGTTIYNPTLTRVVYPGGMIGPNGEKKGDGGYILYGIPEKKKLAQIPSQDWGHKPEWFADGSQFIVMTDDRFYKANADGVVSVISQKDINYPVNFYSLSPDGNQLALWLLNTLAILDTNTGELIDTCILAGYNLEEGLNEPPNPVWSPDGKCLVISANFNKENHLFDTVLVDLTKREAYKLADNFSPMGWMLP